MDSYNFQVGDTVSHFNSRGILASIRTITRMTKTLVVLDNNYRYKRDNGRAAGDNALIRGFIRPTLDEHYKTIEKREALLRIERTKLANLELDTLKRIVAILDEVDTAPKVKTGEFSDKL